jgi:two-component system, chemotaxis family, CheB/CheR fusion protein
VRSLHIGGHSNRRRRPSILVGASHQVLHLSENAGRYTQPIGGALTGDIADLIRPEFRAELRAALHRAFDQHQPTLSLPILVNFNGAPHRVDLQVKPISLEEGAEGTALVLFIEGEAVDPSLVSRNVQQATDEAVRRITEELELTQARRGIGCCQRRAACLQRGAAVDQ